MGCQSCGRARTQVSRSSSALPRASAVTGTVRTVDSQTIAGKKVQTAVAANPNTAPKRTKV